MYCFFVKQKTAYDMRISDWSSDVCSSDLRRLHRTSCFIMLLPNDAGLQHAAGGIEWVNRRIDAEFGDCTVKHRRCVKVREAGGWRRIGQVVGRHVNGLHRGDRTLIGRRNARSEERVVGKE